jgi:hypothetical protein
MSVLINQFLLILNLADVQILTDTGLLYIHKIFNNLSVKISV